MYLLSSLEISSSSIFSSSLFQQCAYRMHSVQIVIPNICQNVYNKVQCIGCCIPQCNMFALPYNLLWWMKRPAMHNNINNISCYLYSFFSTHILIELTKVKIKNKWTPLMELNLHIIIIRSWGQQAILYHDTVWNVYSCTMHFVSQTSF